MSPERHLSLDILRVVSATAIIVIHTTAQSYFHLDIIGYRSWLVTSALGWFMMWGTQVFLMISGYLLLRSPSSTATFYHKRFQRLFVPLVFWSLLYYLYYHPTQGSISEFFTQLFHHGTNYHLYFLNIIIGLYALTPFLKWLLPRLNLSLVVPSLLLLSSTYYHLVTFFSFPELNSLFTWFVLYVGYYLAGYWLGQLPPTRRPLLLLVLAFLLHAISIYFTHRLVFLLPTHEQDIVLVSRLSLPILVSSILIFYSFVHLPNALFRPIRYLARLAPLTLGAYFVHPLILILLQIFPLTTTLMADHYWLWYPALLLSTVIISFSISWLFRRLPILRLTV